MKRVLMISFQFPPLAGTSGVQRALRFAQQLPDEGWTPSILTVHPRAYEHAGTDLLDEVPRGLTVRRAFGLDAARHLSLAGRYPGALARPDRWTSWLLGAVPAGLAMIRAERPDVLWSTYPIPTAHLIGHALARLSGLPWVADFRDPMAHDGYPADPVLWRSFEAVERLVFQRASRMSFTTPGAARLYAGRYPASADRLRVIENGYSEEAFEAAERLAATRPRPELPRVLLHSGVVYPDWRSPAGLFRALAAAKAAGRVCAATFQLRLRATAHDAFVRDLAAAHGVSDLVQVLPSLPYVEALAEMLAADGLLLLQSRDCNDQIPAKAYEYLRARRPVLTLADPAGDTARLLQRAGLHHLAPLEDAEAIGSALHRFLDDWATPSPVLPDLHSLQACSRRARTAELARVLDEARLDRTAAPRPLPEGSSATPPPSSSQAASRPPEVPYQQVRP